MTDSKIPGWYTREWMQRQLTALREALDVNADMKRQMVEFLFDVGLWSRTELTFENALARFNSNLNPGRGTHFKIAEVIALCKKFERPQMLMALAAELGYEVRRCPTEERRQALQERLALALERHTEEVAQARRELLALGSDGYTPRVEAPVREGRASFSLPPAEDDDATPVGF